MEENHELRKVYNYEFTCPNCKQLNRSKTNKFRMPFYCKKCGAKNPLKLKVKYSEELVTVDTTEDIIANAKAIIANAHKLLADLGIKQEDAQKTCKYIAVLCPQCKQIIMVLPLPKVECPKCHVQLEHCS